MITQTEGLVEGHDNQTLCYFNRISPDLEPLQPF